VSRWASCKRREFIRKLRELGFDGPFSGSRHQFMVFEKHRLTVPSNSEYSVPQLRMLLQEAEEIIGWKITASEWAKL